MPAQPTTLRADEEVIEEFSVSRKDTILLGIIGLGAIGSAIITTIFDDPILDALAAGAGPLGPVLFLVIELALAVLGIYLIALGLYFQIGYDFFLTDQRVIESVGFLSRRELSTDYNQINDLIVRQDFINKLLLGTGTLGITTPGTAGEEFKLINIDKPIGRRDLLRQLIRADVAGEPINREVVADAKVKVGLAATREEALASLNGVTTEQPPVPLPEPLADRSLSAQPPTPLITSIEVTDANDGGVEDLHGDGIDESDRLRAAQKKMQTPSDE